MKSALLVRQAAGYYPAFKYSEETGLVHPATPPRSRMFGIPEGGIIPSHLQRQDSSAGAIPPLAISPSPCSCLHKLLSGLVHHFLLSHLPCVSKSRSL